MQRFQYDNLTSDQLRIGIALLNQEGAVVEALEAAVEKAVGEAVSPFGITASDITGGNSSGGNGGAPGGARADTTKSPVSEARRTQRPRGNGSAKASKSSKVSPGQLASRQLQGLYIAAIRSVPQSRRAKYKALVKGPGGRQAAIDAIHRDYAAKA